MKARQGERTAEFAQHFDTSDFWHVAVEYRSHDHFLTGTHSAKLYTTQRLSDYSDGELMDELNAVLDYYYGQRADQREKLRKRLGVAA